jgi:hypothetical protein
MRKARVLVVATLVAVGASGAHAHPSVSPSAARDARVLHRDLAAYHPALYRSVTRAHFRAEVDRLVAGAPQLSRNELVVGLMRLAALPGPRNGHTGIFPLDAAHREPLHALPVRLYDFADGVFVVDDAAGGRLTGLEVVAIAGTPITRVLELVRPLVPRDNDSTARGLAPHFAITVEVLDGLGVADGVGPVEMTLERPGGERLTETLTPVPAAEYTATFADPLHGHYPAILPQAPRPLYLSQMGRELWLRRLEGGKAVYVGYNSALASTTAVAARLEKLARDRSVRRVVVDVRLNGGGSNAAYVPLLRALGRPQVNQRGKLFVLAGRATFSAAGSFVADADRATRALVVGEPTGGGVNQYGDATTFALPSTGLNVYVATEYVVRGTPKDRRLAIAPDIRVELTSTDYFAGRDPVLARALRGL